jgi:DNA-binding MarR family transcriptional regulator
VPAARRADKNAVTVEEYQGTAALRASLRRFLRGSERTVRAHGLTPQRYDLLLAIKGAPDGSERATITDLCNRLELAQSSVSQLARRAENLGLLRRELAASDARVRYLHLTARGERRLAGAVAELRAERAQLAAALTHLSEEPEPPSR